MAWEVSRYPQGPWARAKAQPWALAGCSREKGRLTYGVRLAMGGFVVSTIWASEPESAGEYPTGVEERTRFTDRAAE